MSIAHSEKAAERQCSRKLRVQLMPRPAQCGGKIEKMKTREQPGIDFARSAKPEFGNYEQRLRDENNGDTDAREQHRPGVVRQRRFQVEAEGLRIRVLQSLPR